MRRRVVGAALTVVGVLMLLFMPTGGVEQCLDCFEETSTTHICGCQTFTNSLVVPLTWRGNWDKLGWVIGVVGIALVVTGLVLLVKRTRSRRSPLVG